MNVLKEYHLEKDYAQCPQVSVFGYLNLRLGRDSECLKHLGWQQRPSCDEETRVFSEVRRGGFRNETHSKLISDFQLVGVREDDRVHAEIAVGEADGMQCVQRF